MVGGCAHSGTAFSAPVAAGGSIRKSRVHGTMTSLRSAGRGTVVVLGTNLPVSDLLNPRPTPFDFFYSGAP